jgi:catalase
MHKQKLTSASGIPYYHHVDTQSIGQRGPLLLQDYILQ